MTDCYDSNYCQSKIGEMTVSQYYEQAGQLSIAYPKVFVGALIGGVVPFLFSSMLIRAVGRAAFLIVKECRLQFRDKEIWAGTKKPNYRRVVDICTATAQKELVGPGMLAIFAPVVVGFAMGHTASRSKARAFIFWESRISAISTMCVSRRRSTLSTCWKSAGRS